MESRELNDLFTPSYFWIDTILLVFQEIYTKYNTQIYLPGILLYILYKSN